MSRKKNIGKHNRLQIVAQSLYDYSLEGGEYEITGGVGYVDIRLVGVKWNDAQRNLRLNGDNEMIECPGCDREIKFDYHGSYCKDCKTHWVLPDHE